MEFAPVIINQSSGVKTVLVGSSMTFYCTALANPTAKYSWLHNGEFISTNQTSSNLRFSKLQVDNSGEYRCLASNHIGAELSKAAIVHVIGKLLIFIICKHFLYYIVLSLDHSTI